MMSPPSAGSLLAQAPPPPDPVLEAQKAMEERMIAELPSLAPIGMLVLAAVGGVALALALPRSRQWVGAAFVAGLHLAAAAAAGIVYATWELGPVMEGTLIVDGLHLFGTGLIGVAGAIAVAMLHQHAAGTDRESELHAVLAAASLGSVVLTAANDAALVALAIGLIGIASYVLVGYQRAANRANEASLKFYIYGTVAGATMVFGLTWWYGLAGTTDLAAMGEAFSDASEPLLVVATVLVLTGLAFKASLVPAHFWAPDTYEGAPTAVSGYLSVVPKAAALIALGRILPEVLPADLLGWSAAIGVIAAVTMVWGAVAMIPQDNAVRLLAYSSISQSGFLLIAVAAAGSSSLALPALLYYLAAYAVTNLAAFAVVMAVERHTGSVELSAFRGLGRAHPWWTLALGLALLSLIGIPPLAGFVGKLEVFTVAIDADMVWLAVVGVIATVISLYPYLRLFAPTILERPASSPDAAIRRLAAAPRLALALAATGSLALGIAAQPFLAAAEDAGAATSGVVATMETDSG